jgi:hypothetical protein
MGSTTVVAGVSTVGGTIAGGTATGAGGIRVGVEGGNAKAFGTANGALALAGRSPR